MTPMRSHLARGTEPEVFSIAFAIEPVPSE